MTVKGTLSLFGFLDQEAELAVLPRSRGWRRIRAGGFFLAGLVTAPLAGMVPPHAPWALGALGLGTFLGSRKLRERFTLLSFQGHCPRCEGELHLPEGTPVRGALSVSCEGCHHDSRLTVLFPPRGGPA
jgi:hypothetical protein